MRKIEVIKILLVLLVIFIASMVAISSFSSQNFLRFNNKLNLGLDLKGGVHLLLEVDSDQYINEQMDMMLGALRKEFRSNKIAYKNLKIDNNNYITFSFEANQLNEIKNTVRNVSNSLQIQVIEGNIKLFYNDYKINDLQNSLLDRSIEIVRMRVDSSGTKEPNIQQQGKNYILLQMPGIDNPQEIKNILGKTAKLTFHLVSEEGNLLFREGKNLPSNVKIIGYQSDEYKDYKIAIQKKALLSGDMLTNASMALSEGEALVEFSFNKLGSKIFGETTKNNVGKQLAIVLDNKILSAATIRSPIMGGSGRISGGFSIDSANELALLLRAGALPAPLKIVEERVIGPNLGADSIESGKKAAVIAFALVAIFMILSYGLFGLFACIALIVNIILIVAALSLLNATLTLPGIAGIILTIGMAVDANVLIYERIKEEMRSSNFSSIAFTIRKGFSSAFSTILDSNITTLVAAILLYIFGVGSIKGFAVTLSIGIFASMFTAITVTRMLIDGWIILAKPKTIFSISSLKKRS